MDGVFQPDTPGNGGGREIMPHPILQKNRSYICSTAMEGGPFSGNLPPKLAISRNMAGI